MFNVINRKFMLVVNNLLVTLLMVLAVITFPLYKGKYLEIVFMFAILVLPYFIATWRTRDFCDVDKIVGLIVLSAYIINITLCGSNLYSYFFMLFINICISILCSIFSTFLYNVVFVISKAKTEYRRLDAAIDYLIFMHNITILVFSCILMSRIGIGKSYLWIVVLVLLALNIINKFITFCIARRNIE